MADESKYLHFSRPELPLHQSDPGHILTSILPQLLGMSNVQVQISTRKDEVESLDQQHFPPNISHHCYYAYNDLHFWFYCGSNY